MKKIPRTAEVITIIYQIIIVTVIILNFNSIPYPLYLLLYHLLIISFLMWLPYTSDTPIFKWLKNWNPVIIIPTNFTELHYLVHNVNPFDWDEILIKMDFDIFGIHPTVWLEKWSNPILTEYLQLIYTSFYFLPIILAFLLYRRGDFRNFQFFVFIIVFGFYASYIGYFLVPAIGPRFTLDHLQSEPVIGLWLTDGIRYTLDTLENIQRDAFPSGHTEMTALSMFYAWRYSKKYFWILSIIGTSLIFSAVYLRYHYVVDVIAGLMLTFFVVVLGPFVYNRIEKLRDTIVN